jgi:hypothetical protein
MVARRVVVNRLPKRECYAVLSDESGVGERVLGYGAIFVAGAAVKEAERVLEDFAQSRSFRSKEFSWKKCSGNEVERYKLFVDKFWDFQTQGIHLDFRALVVDVHLNPLTREPWSTSDEEGFYKFYHFFVTRSLEQIGATAPCVDLRVAVLEDQYPYRTEILQKTVGGRLKEEFGDRTLVTEVVRGTPKMVRLHQLADVLLGAVTYRVNNRDPKGASRKRELCEHVEAKVGRSLDHDFYPRERPFNVWFFSSSGQDRWGKGSRGRA